jgi:hypothetical protein
VSVCLIAMETCATAHFWARELMALGHQVRFKPPAYVKAYGKHQKTGCEYDRLQDSLGSDHERMNG